MNKLNKQLKNSKMLKNIALIITLLLTFSGCSNLNKAKILLPPTWIGMQKIAPKVYVDRDMNKTQQEDLLTWIDATYKYNKNIDKNDIVVTYAVAGHEVSKWYKKVGEKGLNELILKIKEGKKFEDVYKK